MTYAVVVADTTGAMVHWNDGAEELFGHAAHGRPAGAAGVYDEPDGVTEPFAPVDTGG